jgi:hypothetical protein
MRPTLIIAALIAASPALAARCPQGQFYRVRLDQCVSLSSPLARPYLGAWSSQKNRAEEETIDTANLGEEIETSPEDSPPATSDPLAADPPPDEVDEAAWLMIPLLRAAAERWAAMVSPPRDETPPPDPWPWLSVYGLGNEHKDFLPRPPIISIILRQEMSMSVIPLEGKDRDGLGGALREIFGPLWGSRCGADGFAGEGRC